LSGEAISLVCVDERGFLRDIERLIKRSIPQHVVAGFEPDPDARAQPVFAQRGRRPSQEATRRTQPRALGRSPSQKRERSAGPGTSRGAHPRTAGKPAAFRARPKTRH
jgi:ATP-dependent RNA helicase RhlE